MVYLKASPLARAACGQATRSAAPGLARWAVQQVAAHHRADTFGRAGEDQVAGLQGPGGRQLLNGFRNVPDQLGHGAALAVLAVDLQSDFGAV